MTERRVKLEEFGTLTPAEKALCAGVGAGEIVRIGDGSRPGEDAGEGRQIRAALLRALILDRVADCPVHDKGVRVAGARITGTLDLQGCRIGRDIVLFSCRFDEAPVLRSARLDSLVLNGAALPGLEADRLQTDGNVFLRSAETAGEVRLVGARLGGNLSCVGAQLRAGKSGPALVADGMQADGHVFLRSAETAGEVRLAGARLGGDLSCTGARLRCGESGRALVADGLQAKGTVSLGGAETTGEVRLAGARLSGDLDCEGAQLRAGESGVALTANRLSAKGAMFWRGLEVVEGVLDLTNAEVGTLCDDRDSWPARGDLMLDRFRYGAFTGTGAPLDADARIDWLDRQDPARWGADFWPQPWEQCAKVLREMGHREEARRILIAKEERQRAARRARASEFLREWLWALDHVLGLTSAYGYRPLRTLWFLVGFWVVGALVFADAATRDQIKPNNPFVLRSPEWAACAPSYASVEDGQPAARNGGAVSQLDCFLAQPEAQGYPTFNALVYSADTLLPVVEIEMQEFWLPDAGQGGWGAFARAYLWFHIALGWALSLLAVAGFTGLIKTQDTE